MNKELIEKIENQVKSINILDNDPFVSESCKNVYRALLVVAENEKIPTRDIKEILKDPIKTTNLLKKFDIINKEKYNGNLSYIFVDINNDKTLFYLIELLRQSINCNIEINNKELDSDAKIAKDFTRINKILSSVFEISKKIKIEKIDSIKFLSTKVGYAIEIKDNYNKLYYMNTNNYDLIDIVREHSLNGKIIYTQDNDYIPSTTNNFNDIKNNDYIIISSDGYFSNNRINSYFVSLKENKIYSYTYNPNNNDRYEFIKDLASSQKEKLMKYINDNDLLNVSIDKLVFDASDTIEINISGKKNVIRNASREFTNNEMHIFDDIVDIVDISFSGENSSLEECPSCHENLLNMYDNKSVLTCPRCKSNYVSLDNKLCSIDNSLNLDIEKLIKSIDDKIAELEAEQNEIDKEIEKNLDEVAKYSIVNKTIDELLLAKKKFIYDWDALLFDTISERWIMDSALYKARLISIIDAIMRRIDDNVSKNQLELLNIVGKYFANQDKESVIKIVKQLKELESK